MAFSKIIFNGSTLVDLTGDSVTAATLISGNTAHDASGTQITGSASGGVTVEPLSVTTNGTYTAPTGKAYSPVTVNVSGGGDSWSWIGKNPTKVQTLTTEYVALKDSELASWTWSTSATTLRAGSDYTTMTVDDSHDYIQLCRYYIHYDFGNWTPASTITDYGMTGIAIAYRYPSTLTNAQTLTRNHLASGSTYLDYNAYYCNSSGTPNLTVNSYYGLCMYTIGAPTISDADTSTPSIVWKNPALYVRGHNTYFSQTAFNNIDMDNTYYKYTCEIWRVDMGSVFKSGLRDETFNLLNNGL